MIEPLLVSATYGGVLPALFSSSLPVLVPPPPAPAPSPSPSPSPPTPVPTLPGTWTYSTGDEFAASPLNSALYNVGMWYGDLNDDGTVTHAVEAGALTLRPKRGTAGALIHRAITTDGKWTTPTTGRYYIEVQAQLAPGAGRWPAIWLFNHNDSQVPARPELDIMETGTGTSYGTAQGGPAIFTASSHTDLGLSGGQPVSQTSQQLVKTTTGLLEVMHTWGALVDVSAGTVTYYFDGTTVGTHTTTAAARPLHLILSEAYDGPYNVGTPADPAGLEAAADPLKFDYWRVWTSPAPAPAPAPTPSPSPSPSPAPSPAGSNPVTTALTGTRTFNVTDDATLDAVPFATLAAGDVVNIHHRPTPYKRLIRVRTSGTDVAPIVINGVTNSSGDRPVFSGDGASVAAGCMPGCFSGTNSVSWQYREAIGLIATAIGPADDYNLRPNHVTIKNLEVVDVRVGLSYTDAMGASHTWDQASAIRVQDGADVVVDNCVIHGNDFGYFTQANNDDALHAPLRPVLRNSRLYNNGMPNRSTEHNIYLQGIDPVVEGCYIGLTCTGSLGSSFKSRSANLVFRYNWVEASERALDIVHSEDSWNGVQAAANYGVSHVYGNVICNDWMRMTRGATYPFHVGGDNMGEDGPAGQATVTDVNLTAGGNLRVYQHTLYAYGNTFIFRSNSNQTYRMSWFDLSLSGTATQPRTTVYEWDNAVLMEGTSEWAQLRYAGQIVHGGGSIAQVTGTLRASHELADTAKFSIVGTLTQGSLGLTDYRVTATAPRSGTPAGLPSTFRSELAAVSSQPRVLSNGTAPRTNTSVIGALQD